MEAKDYKFFNFYIYIMAERNVLLGYILQNVRKLGALFAC